MTLNQFKITRNRQMPNLMYQYTYKDKIKYQITTMNSGKTFNASIQSLALNGRTYLSDLWKEGFNSPEDCIEEFKKKNLWLAKN